MVFYSQKMLFSMISFSSSITTTAPSGTVLMKNVQSASGKQLLHPSLIYSYKILIESLKEVLLWPGFVEMCQKWRQLHLANDAYNDVYDDQI